MLAIHTVPRRNQVDRVLCAALDRRDELVHEGGRGGCLFAWRRVLFLLVLAVAAAITAAVRVAAVRVAAVRIAAVRVAAAVASTAPVSIPVPVTAAPPTRPAVPLIIGHETWTGHEGLALDTNKILVEESTAKNAHNARHDAMLRCTSMHKFFTKV